ncbi:MAG: DUF4340 domain-containing protein [Candidatus Riflebacteria bacterium]
MKKRFRPTLIAFVVLVILLTYANYYETEEILAPGMQKPQPILNLNADQIDVVSWVSKNAETMRITRKDGTFRMEVPGLHEIEAAEASGILEHFVQLKFEMVVAEHPADPGQFGINENSPVVRFNSGEKVVEVKLGSKSPVGGSYYLMRADDPRVFMVPGYIRGDFHKTPENVRKRGIFSDPFGNPVAVEIQSQKASLIVEKKEAIEWEVKSPKVIPADGEMIAGLIQTLQNLRISRFVEDDPKNPVEWGFASSSFRIILSNSAGQKFGIETGEISGNETYFRVIGKEPIHAILNSDVRDLNKTLSDLRSKNLPDLARDQLISLEFQDASGSVKLIKQEKNWEMDGKIVEPSLVDSFLDFYDATRATQFIDAGQKDANGFSNLEKCDYFALNTSDGSKKFWFGEKQGVNQSVFHDNEILVIKIELHRAFVDLLQNVRNADSEKKTISD